MKKLILQLSVVLCLMANINSSMALTDTFYSTGEDLEFLMDSESTYALEEIEYKLRKFVLYRKLEDFLFSYFDEYQDNTGN